MKSTAELTIEYTAWLTAQQLPERDAMELLAENITDEQRQWLTKFVVDLDAAELDELIANTDCPDDACDFCYEHPSYCICQ